MAVVTLCVPPRPGELCAPVRFLVREDSLVMELTARHRITGVEWDEREQAVAMVVEITDPQTARPVDVRIDIIDPGSNPGRSPSRGPKRSAALFATDDHTTSWAPISGWSRMKTRTESG